MKEIKPVRKVCIIIDILIYFKKRGTPKFHKKINPPMTITRP